MILAANRAWGSLAELHAWAEQTRPAGVEVEASGVLRGQSCSWTAPCDLTIRGGTWTGRARPGGPPDPRWWLSFRHAGRLVLQDLTVRHYARGGVDIGADTGRTTARITACTWQHLGGGPGYAAVYCTATDLTVIGCAFLDLVNPPPVGPLMHAVYAHVGSIAQVCGGNVLRCSGDPLRARHGSVLTAVGVSSDRAGVQALASTWRAEGEATSTLATRDCHPGRTYGGRPALAAYRVR